jgi:thioredoxin-like negative regulator of GroEL
MTPAVFAAGCIGPDSATLHQTQCREDESEILSQQLVLKKGADYFHQAVDMNPLDGENRSELARALVFQERRHEAIEQLKDGIRIMCEHDQTDEAAKLREQLNFIEGGPTNRE